MLLMQRPSANQATARTGQHQNRTIWLGLQTQNLVGRQAVLGSVHLKISPVVGGKPPTKRAEQKPTVRVLGNGHDRQIGKTVLEAKRYRTETLSNRLTPPSAVAIQRKPWRSW